MAAGAQVTRNQPDTLLPLLSVIETQFIKAGLIPARYHLLENIYESLFL